MNRRILSRVALLLAASIALPLQTASAGTCEVSPFVGAMIPANTLLLLTSAGSYIRMKTHTIYGLDVEHSLSPRMSLGAVLATGTGSMEVVGGTTALEIGSTAFIADLRGRFRLMGTEDDNLGLVLGVGYTDFNSGLLDLAHETDTGTFLGRLTGIAGVDLHGRLTDRLGLKAVFVDRIHVSGLSASGLTGPDNVEKTQNDLCITAGLTIKTGH
ncbi:MAG TPA: hypothetical protein VFX78_04585 [Candidatus Eisenbacteria bacterium]|nr:hypothetical protein [Candidatus Eisenbacteria bacterium]